MFRAQEEQHAAHDPRRIRLACETVTTCETVKARETRTESDGSDSNSESKRDLRENQRISTRIDLEVLNSVNHIMTTSTRDSECVSVSV